MAGTTVEVTPKKVLTIREQVVAAFPDAPVMVRIAQCESQMRQFDTSGNTLRGIANPKDRGIFQINEFWNLATAQRLGFNIYTVKGNIAMARWMYDHQGTTPWNWSKGCWGASSK